LHTRRDVVMHAHHLKDSSIEAETWVIRQRISWTITNH
jgi:hypothetical protein